MYGFVWPQFLGAHISIDKLLHEFNQTFQVLWLINVLFFVFPLQWTSGLSLLLTSPVCSVFWM